MLLTDIFGRSFMDDFFEDFANSSYYRPNRIGSIPAMKADVQDLDNAYQIDLDLPGFRKDEIQMQLANGNLTVSASKGLDKDEKNEEGAYIRRERYAGSMSRSFYVGEHVKEEDIHPRYENGILTFHIPKEEKKAVEEKKHYISIEG